MYTARDNRNSEAMIVVWNEVSMVPGGLHICGACMLYFSIIVI